MNKNKGITLIWSLVVLLIIGVGGYFAYLWITRTQEPNTEISPISSNTQGYALGAAQAALANAEHWLSLQTEKPAMVTKCTTPPCVVWGPNILPNLTQQSESWWKNIADTIEVSEPKINSTLVQSYIIEYLYFIPNDLSPNTRSQEEGIHYYRIIARGSIKDSSQEVILESIYSKLFE